MFIGILVGQFFLSQHSNKRIDGYRLLILGIGGMVYIFLGMLVDWYFPINKNLWSSSYVLFTSGLAMVCFGFFYYVIDIKKFYYIGRPLEIYGTNSLAVFFFSALLAKIFHIVQVENHSLKEHLMSVLFTPNLTSYNASLAWAVLHLLFWFFVLWFLYHKKIYIKL